MIQATVTQNLSDSLKAIAELAAKCQSRADLQKLSLVLAGTVLEVNEEIRQHPSWALETEAYRAAFDAKF